MTQPPDTRILGSDEPFEECDICGEFVRGFSHSWSRPKCQVRLTDDNIRATHASVYRRVKQETVTGIVICLNTKQYPFVELPPKLGVHFQHGDVVKVTAGVLDA